MEFVSGLILGLIIAGMIWLAYADSKENDNAQEDNTRK